MIRINYERKNGWLGGKVNQCVEGRERLYKILKSQRNERSATELIARQQRMKEHNTWEGRSAESCVDFQRSPFGGRDRGETSEQADARRNQELRIWSRRNLNCFPLIGFVKRSANISLVGVWTIERSPSWCFSRRKKNLLSMCSVRCESGFSFWISRIVEILSWWMMVAPTQKPSSRRSLRIPIT